MYVITAPHCRYRALYATRSMVDGWMISCRHHGRAGMDSGVRCACRACYGYMTPVPHTVLPTTAQLHHPPTATTYPTPLNTHPTYICLRAPQPYLPPTHYRILVVYCRATRTTTYRYCTRVPARTTHAHLPRCTSTCITP